MTTLTPARRRALEVIAATHPRPARYSNSTSASTEGAKVALIHWQAADWLIAEGFVLQYITAEDAADWTGLHLTDAGRVACAENGIEVRG